MRRDGTERASTETSAMDINGEFDHFVSGNDLIFIFRMRQTSVRQIERGIDFGSRHRRIRRIDNNRPFPRLLNHPRCFVFIRFFFNDAKILCLLTFILQTFFE